MPGSEQTSNDDDRNGSLSASDILVAWRREADYWQKRVERSDDQAAGLLAACLTVGAVATAAAGYVQTRAPGHLDWVKIGIGCVIAAGIVTLCGRMFSSPVTRRLKRVQAHGELNRFPTFTELLELEINHAATGKALTRTRETALAIALIAFAVGVCMIAYAGSQALDKPPPPPGGQSAGIAAE